MMRIVFILLLLFASIGLGVQLHGDPGYILIAFRHWTIESTLWVALFGLFILFVIFHLFLLFYRTAAYLPSSLQHWRLKHRAERAQNKTTQGLIEFSEGYWKAAKNHLIQALPHTETPLINYLIAARAAQELGNTKQRDNYLREAQKSMPSAKIAVELTQAQLQLAHKQWEQALATLRHLHDLAPKHPYVLKLLAHLYEAIEDWPNLITLLPHLTRNHVLPEQKLTALTYRTYLGEVHHLIEQQAWAKLNTCIDKLPKALKYNPELITAYARALMTQKENIQAEICLRRTLQKNLDPSLLQAYSELPACTVRIHAIESLLKHHAHSATLHRCLGELYTTLQLWGKAQTHLEKSLQLKASPETYHALGQLLETLKDTPAAFEAYKSGLRAMLKAP
ncbi:MAG: heme biosynthesis HemY N-terminal domain-containing protein [Legionellaceae bacterium]|nr:heme biosynthesis HemY N-terminal domain-containing protein [Legionellaceae bacterium]